MSYQDASLWTVYRWYVIVGGGLILTQACLIAVLVLQRTGRRRAAQSLAERLRFERLLSELSARLVPVSLDAVDVEIERGFRRVVEFLGVDRASLHKYVPGGNVARICWASFRAETTGARGADPVLHRRRGKSLVSAFLAVYLACFRRYDNVLAAGKEGTIVLAAKVTTRRARS